MSSTRAVFSLYVLLIVGGLIAVGSMAVLTIYLRQRGSPESKPVGAPHSVTGAEG